MYSNIWNLNDHSDATILGLSMTLWLFIELGFPNTHVHSIHKLVVEVILLCTYLFLFESVNY